MIHLSKLSLGTHFILLQQPPWRMGYSKQSSIFMIIQLGVYWMAHDYLSSKGQLVCTAGKYLPF